MFKKLKEFLQKLFAPQPEPPKWWLAVKAWFKKNWMTLVNYLVIIIAYSNIYGKDGVVFAEVLLGLWLFASAAYGMFKLFSGKNKLNPQPEPPNPAFDPQPEPPGKDIIL